MPGPPSMFDAPPPASSLPASLVNYIQPNFGHGLRIWWAFFWPTSLITMVLNIATNIGVKHMYQSMEIPAQWAGPILKYNLYFYTYLVAFFVMYYILHKNFRHFRLGLLTNHGGEGAQPLEPTFGRTARVWWTYSWRSLVYRLIMVFVTTIPAGIFVGLFERIPPLHALATLLVIVAIDGAAGLFVIYSNILDENFGDFHVCLLPRESHIMAPVAGAPTPAQT